MASVLHLLLVLLSLFSFVISDDTSDQLLKGMNDYRRSLSLSPLQDNEKAGCLAEKLADQLEDRSCTTTHPGVEQLSADLPVYLKECQLSATAIQEASIMPVRMPNRNQDLLLSLLTESQFSGNLNNSKYVAAGVSNEGDWVVVILNTNKDW